jgi:hypothetical protein
MIVHRVAGIIAAIAGVTTILSAAPAFARSVEVPWTPDQQAAFQAGGELMKKANALLEAGKLKDAEAGYRDAIAFGDQDPIGDLVTIGAYLGLADTLDREGKKSDAIAVYREYLYDLPKRNIGAPLVEVPALKYVRLLNETGNWTEAIYWYDRTIPSIAGSREYAEYLDIDFDPTDPEPDLLEAATHVALGLEGIGHGADAVPSTGPQSAVIPIDVSPVDEFAAAVKLYPNSPIANYLLAEALRYKPGRAADAKAAYEKAAQYGAGDIKAESERTLRLEYSETLPENADPVAPVK